MALVLHHSRATGNAKLVLVGIANHDGDGGAWPAIDTLATYANTSRRAVQYALRELEANGELAMALQDGGTRGPAHLRPNRYVVQVTCPPTCDRSSRHRCNVDGCGRPSSSCGHSPELVWHRLRGAQS
jgi:hypothetical protein